MLFPTLFLRCHSEYNRLRAHQGDGVHLHLQIQVVQLKILFVQPLSTLHVSAFICNHPKLSQLVCLDKVDKVDKVDRLQLEAEAVDGLGGDLDGGVGGEAGVELDGVAEGLEDVADVAGDVDEHEGVELCREQRCRDRKSVV